MRGLAAGAHGIVALVMLTGACARPTANVMAMRDIPREQQDRDRADCEREAGHLDVTKPITGSMSGQLLYAAAGAVIGVLFAPVVLQQTSDPKEVALAVGGGAAVGAALGFVTGTVVGWKSGVDRAHDAYLSAYTACMRERGYTVIRDRR
jgi:heme A synthase